MKKSNNKSLCIQAKRKAIYGEIAFIVLMGASSISFAMDDEERTNRHAAKVNSIAQKLNDEAIAKLYQGAVDNEETNPPLANHQYGILAEKEVLEGLSETQGPKNRLCISDELSQKHQQNSLNSSFGIENNEMQMSLRSLYLKSVELKPENSQINQTGEKSDFMMNPSSRNALEQ